MNQWFGLNLLKMDKNTEAMQASHPLCPWDVTQCVDNGERQEGAEAGAPGSTLQTTGLAKEARASWFPPCGSCLPALRARVRTGSISKADFMNVSAINQRENLGEKRS